MTRMPAATARAIVARCAAWRLGGAPAACGLPAGALPGGGAPLSGSARVARRLAALGIHPKPCSPGPCGVPRLVCAGARRLLSISGRPCTR
jgi:hypothetical protein